jgi:hypothetical protein
VCNFPTAPRAAVLDASQRDYRVVVVEDATSRLTPERLADAVALGAHALRTETVVHHISSRPIAAVPRGHSALRVVVSQLPTRGFPSEGPQRDEAFAA